MGTTTTNYSLNKPTVGGDEDQWGTDLNASMDSIDTQMKTNETAAATAQTAADASAQDSDIGVTIQAYDADTAKTDVAQTFTADQSHGDNVKAKFGAGDDLQMYHSGTSSVIKEVGTGDLEIQTNGAEIQLTGNAGTDYMARFISNGAVKLYYDNATKLATTSTGIDVTGTVTADGLVVENTGTVYSKTTSSDGLGDAAHRFYSGSTFKGQMGWDQGTDVIGLYGANSSTIPTLSVDSSGNVGIGTSSPVNKLDVKTGSQGVHIAETPGPYYGTAIALSQDVGADNRAMRLATKYSNSPNPSLVIESSNSHFSYGTNPDVSATTGWSEVVRFPATGGITFNGDTAAANTLDDYEEGTWTPAFTASTSNPTMTYIVQIGLYTKTGNTVTVHFQVITATRSGGSGHLYLTGLPFTPNGVGHMAAPISFNFNWVGNAAPQHVGAATNSGLLLYSNAVTNTINTPSDIHATGNSYLYGSCTYRTLA